MQVGSQERLQPSVKHGGETVIFRGCFSASVIGELKNKY